MPTAHIPEKSGDLLSVASQESQAQGESRLFTLDCASVFISCDSESDTAVYIQTELPANFLPKYGNDLEALQIHLCIFVPSLQLRTNAVWKHRLTLQRKQLPQQTRKGEEGLQ